MKYIIRYKALDQVTNKTYMDQSRYELYDLYDLQAKENVPALLLSAPVLSENERLARVNIDYPVYNNTFTLEGDSGVHYSYVEAGKKAFVRGGRYSHPTKGWSSEIKMLSPVQYIEACHKIFKRRGSEMTVEELIAFKDSEYDIKKVFDAKKGNVNYCVLDYKDNSQEGLHRAIYALREGYDKIPVTIIRKG